MRGQAGGQVNFQDFPRNYRQRQPLCPPRLPEMECPGSGEGPPTATNSHQLLLSARLTGATSATGEDIDPRGRHHTGACYDGDVHSTTTTHHPPPDTIKQVAPPHLARVCLHFIRGKHCSYHPTPEHSSPGSISIWPFCQQIRLAFVIIAQCLVYVDI